MRDFQVRFLKLLNSGVLHSGLGCNLCIKKSIFGTNPKIQYQYSKEETEVFFLPFIFLSFVTSPPPPGFLTRLVSHINNSSKPLVSLANLVKDL